MDQFVTEQEKYEHFEAFYDQLFFKDIVGEMLNKSTGTEITTDQKKKRIPDLSHLVPICHPSHIITLYKIEYKSIMNYPTVCVCVGL